MERKHFLRKKWYDEYDLGGYYGDEPFVAISEALEEDGLIPLLVNFHASYPELSRFLFNISGKFEDWQRIGKGEILLYFLFDDVELGGHSSSVDIWIDGKPRLEVKAARREGDKYAHFMLGIDEVPASLNFFTGLLNLFQDKEREGLIQMPERYVNITRSMLDRLAAIAPEEYGALENEYLSSLLSGPIGEKTYIFFDSDLALPFYVGKLTPENLKIERVSGGLTRLWFSPEGFQS